MSLVGFEPTQRFQASSQMFSILVFTHVLHKPDFSVILVLSSVAQQLFSLILPVFSADLLMLAVHIKVQVCKYFYNSFYFTHLPVHN